MKKKNLTFLLSSVVMLLLIACAPEPIAEPVLPSNKTEGLVEDQNPGLENANSVDFPQIQELTFTAADGTKLEGKYYPSVVPDAPLIILMHWARGDQNDYCEIASWLQNSGKNVDCENNGDNPWLDPSWFPDIEAGKSYAVFTFTFRDCKAGCPSFLSAEWLDDVQSAVEFAYHLDSIDQQRIITAGASIGADGAADGCLYLNEQYPGSCKGAFSISPGSYLTQDYTDVVQKLSTMTEVVPAWCLYAQADKPAAEACSGLQAANFTAIETGTEHGMNLVDPRVEPNPLQLLLDFIADTVG